MVALAKLFAIVQTGICGLLALLWTVGYLMRHRPFESVVYILWPLSVILTAAGIAFFLRSNRARVFLAGIHSLLALGWTLLAVVSIAIGVPGMALVLLIPLAFAIAGALAFVSVDVRAWCGEHVVVRGNRGDRPGPIRM